MPHPTKTLLLKGDGFLLSKDIPYRDLLAGVWHLQIESISIENLPPNVTDFAALTTPFIKSVEPTVYGNFNSTETNLHLLPITSNSAFISLRPTRFLITNPAPLIQFRIKSSLASEIQKNCKVKILCYLFRS